MDFSFSEEQELFRKMVRTFSEKELAPGYLERAKKPETPWPIIKRMAELGLLGLTIPVEYGGQGADYVTLGIATEEVSRGDFNCTYFMAIGGMSSGLFAKYGAEDLRRAWLPKIIAGEKIVGVALTEPDCGSDATAIRATAKRDGDEYILNGEKSSISFTNVMEAVYLFAKTDSKAGAKGVSCFFLPMDLPGITRSVFRDMGEAPIGRGAFALEDVRIPANNLIGREGQGFYLIMNQFDYARALIGLMCLGSTYAAMEETIAYTKERKAFGKPIARFEGVSFPIAEHLTRMEAARLLCYKTLWLRDQGMPHTKEAAMCKWWVPRLCVDAIHDALLIHGHIGYSDECPQEQRLRDVIGMEIADGTAQIQKIIIAREIIGRDYLPY